jgi:DNA-binding MarR family transcriptional regulator
MEKANRRAAAGNPARAANGEQNNKPKKELELAALQRTPGFMIRLLQIQIFEAFFEYFSVPGFSPAEHSVLILIRDNPSVTQSEVASVLRIQLPNLVKILLKLEDKGFIKRKRSTRDKRAVEMTLSARGKTVTAEIARMGDEFNRITLSPLSEAERKQFLDMLARLVRARAGAQADEA